jgi:hypothetical protein
MDSLRRGGCNCGAVRVEIRGAPVRAGLCHCLTCRKATGSPFMSFADWPRSQVTVTGETSHWRATTDRRHFCPACGSQLFATEDGNDEIEIRLGILDDAPGDIIPEYELWTDRREPWLTPVAGAAQYGRDRLRR